MSVTSGTIQTQKLDSSYGGKYTIYVTWNLLTQDTTQSSSVIEYNCYITADDPLIETYPAAVRYFDIKITDYTGEHSVYYRTQIDNIGMDGNMDIFSGEQTEVAHGYTGDGTFTLTLECVGIPTQDVSVSSTFQLPSLDSLSTATIYGDAIIGQTATVYVNAQNGFAYDHDVYAVINGTETQIASSVAAGTFSWNTSSLANSIYATIPNSSTATVGLKCVTRYGATTIGNTSTPVQMQADEAAAAPTITGAGYEDTNATTLAITSDSSKIIRNKSTLVFEATTFAANCSATLVNVAITINGETITDSSISGQSTVSSWSKSYGALNVSENANAVITLTDSRGLTATASMTITVINYVSPKATVTCRRVDNYYSETDCTCTATISSVDGLNSVVIKMSYKKTSDGSYGAEQTITSGTTYQLTLTNTYSWNVKFVLTDLFETVTIIKTVDIGMPLVFFDHIRSSFGVNCFPQNNNSIESEGLQIDTNICVGMASLSSGQVSFSSGTQDICFGLNYELLSGIFNGITIPAAYTKTYRIMAQVSTSGTNKASITIGGVTSNALATGGNARKMITTDYFTESDLTLETTDEGSGLILKGVNTGTGTVYIYNVTVACYLSK